MKKAESPVDNVSSVAKLEAQYRKERTIVQSIGDAIGSFAGTMSFIVLHVAVFTFWFLVNSKVVSAIPAFDPYPFILLSMVVSVEAVLLSAFVLMKQNRESKRAEQRQQLTLQIDLLAEQEATKTLQLLERICDRLEIKEISRDQAIKTLSEETAVEQLAEDLKEHLPTE